MEFSLTGAKPRIGKLSFEQTRQRKTNLDDFVEKQKGNDEEQCYCEDSIHIVIQVSRGEAEL